MILTKKYVAVLSICAVFLFSCIFCCAFIFTDNVAFAEVTGDLAIGTYNVSSAVDISTFNAFSTGSWSSNSNTKGTVYYTLNNVDYTLDIVGIGILGSPRYVYFTNYYGGDATGKIRLLVYGDGTTAYSINNGSWSNPVSCTVNFVVVDVSNLGLSSTNNGLS